MPTAIENSTHKHPAYPNMSLFAHSKRDDGQANWYLRATFSRTEQSVRSLKLPYIPNDETNKNEADKAALQLYYELDKRRQQGFTNKRKNIPKLIDAFLKEIKEQTEENTHFAERGMTPPNKAPNAKTPLNKDKCAQITHVMTNLVRPFFESEEYKNKQLDGLIAKDIEDWSKWRQRQNGKWQNGTLNKQNIVLRSFFKWSIDKGYLISALEIKEFPVNLRNNRRPDLDTAKYQKLLKHIRDKWEDPENKRIDEKVYNRLFYLYICTIDATGIRPFNSEKNAIKRSDVQIKKNKAGETTSILIKRREKGKDYMAVADLQWESIYEDILAIHKAWGIESEYLFAHPKSARGCIKNEPIKSFDTQWTKAVEALGWNKKGDKQKDRISKYSIRHRYATRRLRSGKISLEELAQVLGSSPTILYKVYWHFFAEKEYSKITEKGYKLNKNAIKEYDEYGMPLKKAKRDK
ncbi:MAG TPA: hypothetical protein EYQ33_00850 [Gammaproteobacteria bacterium]|nr:hypothetical protein [Gammaproteobacteria bacterium]